MTGFRLCHFMTKEVFDFKGKSTTYVICHGYPLNRGGEIKEKLYKK